MRKLQTVLEATIKAIPECLAVGRINISSGELLEIESEKSQSPKVIASLIMSLANLFEGPNVRLIKDIFSSLDYEGSFFKKLVINSNNMFYVFMSVREEDKVGFFIFPMSVDIDAALIKARSSIADLLPVCRNNQ